MANPTVHAEFAMPDPNVAPLNLVQLFQLANTLISAEIRPPNSFLPYIIGSGTPDAGDRDKVWIEQDSQGRPVAIRVWWTGSASWRRVYNGMLGEIRGYTGNPGDDFFHGLGIVGGEYDGWALCDGDNGTPDFSDKFLIGAHMNNNDHPGYTPADGWVTWIGNTTGQHTGGARDFTLNADNTYIPPFDPGAEQGGDDLIVGEWSADGNIRPDTGGGQMYGEPVRNAGVPVPPTSEPKNKLLMESSEGNITPDSVSIIPPFIALGWIMFVGYRT